jgi:hypothetical protein
MIPGWRLTERTELYVGLGVQLLDDHTNQPVETTVKVSLEIEDGPGWRVVERAAEVLPAAVYYYPRLERYGDARGRAPRRYRVRARSDYYWPFTRIGGAETIVQVSPYDDVTVPAALLARPAVLRMVPRPAAPFGITPTFRGRVETVAKEPIPDARIFYMQPQPAGPPRRIEVLSEHNGDYALPVRRIAAAGLTLRVTTGGPPMLFPFASWRAATASTQNLSL